MKSLFSSLAISAFVISGLVPGFSALAMQNGTQDKTLKPALHRIEQNSKLVHEYASIYEWDNVNYEVDRIVAAEHKLQKALEGMPEAKNRAEELHAAIKELRSARLDHNRDRAVAAADKVGAVARELNK